MRQARWRVRRDGLPRRTCDIPSIQVHDTDGPRTLSSKIFLNIGQLDLEERRDTMALLSHYR